MKMNDLGYVVSPARLTAFGLLVGTVKNFLERRNEIFGEFEPTSTGDEILVEMETTYDALMKIVEEESRGKSDPTGSAGTLSPR